MISPDGKSAFDVYTAGAPGAPGVIVVQEWWGANDGIKAHAARIAAAGYRVLVPDLYKGKLALDAEEAHHNMSNLDFPAAAVELAQAAAHLKREGSPKVGIVGFCMGSALCLGAAAASADIVCAAPFYGVNYELFKPEDLLGKPVQGHVGQKDGLEGFSDMNTMGMLENKLRAAGNSNAEVFVYEGVGHAFMNESPAPFADFTARQAKMGDGFPPYDPKQAEFAWSRLVAFFDKHLK